MLISRSVDFFNKYVIPENNVKRMKTKNSGFFWP